MKNEPKIKATFVGGQGRQPSNRQQDLQLCSLALITQSNFVKNVLKVVHGKCDLEAICLKINKPHNRPFIDAPTNFSINLNN